MKSDKSSDIEYILCASIWYKNIELKNSEVLEQMGFRPVNINRGIVVSGWRHVNCIAQITAITGLRSIPAQAGESVQGFLTSKNRFVNRENAAAIAYAANQISDRTKRLFSEDLY